MASMTDGEVIDRLSQQFTELQQLGVHVPEDMPLDSEEHRRAAVHYLSNLIFRAQRGQRTWT